MDYEAYIQENKDTIDFSQALEWRNVDKVFLVNGHVEKVDANFVGGLTFDKINDTGIHIGPYPQLE